MHSVKRHVHSVSGHPNLFFIYDLYRVDTEVAEVHADIARSFLKSIRSLLPLTVLFLKRMSLTRDAVHHCQTLHCYSTAHNQIKLISGSGAVALRFR